MTSAHSWIPTAREASDLLALNVLIYEFPFNAHEEAEALIRKRLQRKKMARIPEARIALLRQLKNELQGTINVHGRSPYYLRPHGKYADYLDYDIPRLIADTARRYPTLSRKVIRWFVPFCVLTYYMR